jgi:hypothetical protein
MPLTQTSKGPKHSIGFDGSVTYNSKTKKICPSDWMFTLFTLCLIVIPTALCLVVVIAMNEKFPIWLKIIFSIAICISVFLCLRMLYKCATTDPGILPNVCVYNKMIPDLTKSKVDTKKEYFAQY